MRNRNDLKLACGQDPWGLGLQHGDGSVDAAGLHMHCKTCPDCGVYLRALTVHMAQYDPEPPQLRRQIEREYFSQQEVATRLGVTSRTVKRWADRGAFPGYALWDGRRRLYKWTDVESFLKQAKVTGARIED